MEITYYGHSCFKIKGKEVSLVIDPFDSQKFGRPLPTLEADALLITHDHFDHNFLGAVKNYRVLINAPGEYEVGGVNIMGILTYHDEEKGLKRGKNTMYYIEGEGVSILHCGDLGHLLDDDTLQQFGDVTALLVPVGGVYTIDAEKAAKVISSIEPSFVVPMHYRLEGSNLKEIGTLEQFLDEMGVDYQTLKPQPSLKLKEGDNELETQVVVLEPR